ncbi:MAG TPA: AsmA family protein [Xanthobacteraceae bacterium]|nr:AsmA family protein [Xanthobacteraceae bacterium]
MQTTLLGLALALIAAILAAFAAPFFIDWNEWRPQLEAQASALAGSRVTIAGNIDLTLLPTPAFVLREVSLGDAEKGTGMHASEVRGSLALTALLSGRFEANEFVISRPAIRLAIEKDGRLLLPEVSTGSQEISVSGFVFEAGSLTIEDRRTNTLLFADDFSARGELLSREGPFRLEGGYRMNGMRWILRASSGRFSAEHTGKVRLTLDRPADALFFEAEGTLSLLKSALHFDGKTILAHKSGPMHWRVASDTTGGLEELRLANLELALGDGELPITLAGEATLVPRAKGSLVLSLLSKRIDLDLGDQKAGAAGASHVLPWLNRARETLAGLPLSAQITIAADGVLAGGQLSRDLRANIRAQDGLVAVERLEARLPGRAFVSIAGKRSGKAFSGPLTFESEETALFARWLLGAERAAKLTLPQALRVKGTFTSSADEISLSNFQSQIENTKVSGRLLMQPWNDGKSYVLQADLEAANLDFDRLLPLARDALDGAGDQRFSLNLYATGAQFLNKPLKVASVALERFDGNLVIKNLTLEDLDGVSLVAKHLPGADKRYEFSAEAVRTGGVISALRYLVENDDFANIAAKYAASRLPLKIKGVATPLQNGWRLAAQSGEAELALDLGGLRDKRRTIEATLRLPETEIGAKGELRFPGEDRFEPVLALTFKSADLRKISSVADRASPSALPVQGSASLARDAGNFVLDKLAFSLAGTKGTGRLVFPLGEALPFGGQLSFDRINAGQLLSIGIGRADQSNAALSTPALSDFPGTLKIETAILQLSERIAIEKAAFDLRAGRSEFVLDNIRGDLGGGKLTASLRISDTSPRAADLRLDLAGVTLARLLPTKALRGTLQASLSLSASGDTQDLLLESISGQGKAVVTGFELDQTDATAIVTVFTGLKDAPEEAKIEQAFLAALNRGPLKVSKLEAPLVVANGILRSGSAKARAGNIEITLSGALHLPKRSMDALLNIELLTASAVRPGAALRWQGAWDAPERKADVRALTTAITLRAIERGAQNPANISVPREERAPPPAKKQQPENAGSEAAPPLPPPSAVPSVPQPRPQN